MTDQHDTAERRPRISVVVSTYRRPERCERLVHALAKQTLPPEEFEVVVVDDGSRDETSSTLERLAGEVPFILRTHSLQVNGGQGRARNLGCARAASDLIAFTDDDCTPEPDWLAAGLKALEADPHLGVVQGRTTQPPDLVEVGLPRWHHRQNILGPSPYLESCNAFYRKAALADAGGFDATIGRWGEDTALGWAVLEAGWQRGFADGAVVIHDVELRGWRWHVRTGFMEKNVIRIAAHHPLFRREVFWRPWAYRARDAAFVLAVLSGAAAFKRPWLAIGTAPYLWCARESPRQPRFVVFWLQLVAVDAARSAGHVVGAVRNRIFVI